MILGPSLPCNALPNATRLFSTTVPDTAADETVLDTQSIPDPVVSVRHHHSFAQIIIRWNCFLASRACSAQPRNISCTSARADRGSDQALQKKMPNADCDVTEKVDIPKRQDDEMHIFLRTSSSALLESSIPSVAHHRSTSRSGLQVASLEFTGLEVAHRMHGAELLAFLFFESG